MNSGAEALYRDVLLEHARHPHHCGTLPGATAEAQLDNPLCGDRVTVYVDVADGVVRAVTFEGNACAVATASASMMTDAVCGMRAVDVADLFERFNAFLRAAEGAVGARHAVPLPGTLAAFDGVREFPARVRCAELPWRALLAALAVSPIVPTE